MLRSALIVCLALASSCRPRPLPRQRTPAPHVAVDGRSASAVARLRWPAEWTTVAPGVSWRMAEVPGDPGALEADPLPTYRWLVLRLDLAQVRLDVRAAPGGLAATAAADAQALAAVNAGFFEHDERPSGLVVSGGALVHPLGARAGSGVLVVHAGRAGVLESTRCDGLDDGGVDLAVQCGQRLVEPGGAPGIRRDDGRRFARTVACVRAGGATLDLVLTWDATLPLRGPGLFRLAQLLAGPSPVGDATGCDLALNLDGGPSTASWLRDAPVATHEPLGPTPWILVVRRRAASETGWSRTAFPAH